MVAPSSTMKTLDGCSYKDLSAQPFIKGISLAVNTPSVGVAFWLLKQITIGANDGSFSKEFCSLLH